MEHVFFKPWVGKNYQNGGIFKKKILVLGESHYCGGCDQCGIKYAKECDDLSTTKIFEELLNGESTGKWTNTFKKFERSLVNKPTTPEESREIWESVAYFNFLQVAMTDTRTAGSYEDYIEGQKAFLEVIEDLQPDLIIVWGIRLYGYLPNEGWIQGEPLVIDGYSVKNGYYQLKQGKKSRVIAVYHPSTGYSWDWWYKVIASQLG
ncbi:MAG: hypothetical protein J6T63_02595 [Bacteroidales bacterium]|nr:hypothetical protein [Bacteroidales bacterium]